MNFIKNYNKTAIIYDGKEISYSEVITKSKVLASKSNLKKQDKAIIYMENKPEFLFSFLGIWENRGVCVCLDAGLSADELIYFIEDSEAKCIYTSKQNLENVKNALKKLERELEIVVADEVDYNEIKLEKDQEFIKAPEPSDVSLMLYTSGTTGKPKGVMLTFDNILVNLEGLDKYNMFVSNDVVLALLPMHHIFPLLGSGVIPLAKGATIVFLKELSSQAMLGAFQKHKVTMMIGVPRLWEMLHKKIMEKVNSGKITKLVFKLAQNIKSIETRRKIFKKVHETFGGNLRFLVSGGSKLDGQISRDFLTLGIQICEGYGMTETAPMISFTPINEIVPGSAGKILPGIEVKIDDDGEILVRGRNVMAGYYNRPEATSETIDSDRWLHTGDLGEFKGEYLYITGRKKEMIVLSNGKNINPIEIEQWIMARTDLIKEMAVAEINSVLTAVIYPDFQKIVDENITNIKETLKWGIIDKYNSKAPNYRKILNVEIVRNDLPKTKIGKIRRFLVPGLLNKNEDENITIVEPDFEEYRVLKKYLEALKNRKITPTAHLELDLGLDSLDMVELMTYLESEFGVKPDDTIIVNNPTVEKLALYVKENKSENRFEKLNWKDYLNKDVDIDLPKSNIALHLIKFFLWLSFKIYIRVKKSGIENIPSGKPVIFVGNHQSLLDGFIFGHVLPFKHLQNSYTIAKVKHFSKWYMRLLADNSNVILVDINKNLGEMLQTAAKVLKNGKNLVIFPEGARTRDGKMLEFKKTFAILSKELNVEVIPFGIKGAYEAFPTGKKFPRPSKVEINFFEGIDPQGKTYDEIVNEARNTIKKWVE
ncbi:AMP-binding protein [Fusobacterium sp.]|uniref:AMP-binding protein n=1 Tax=Fusobacterium sp. TaxID=68766 RepID=UPI00396C3EAE